jgi:hypothetical protein
LPRFGERNVRLALALVAAVAGCSGAGSCGSATIHARPDLQVREALARQTRATLSDDDGSLGGRTIELDPIRFRDVVSSEIDGRATVVSMVDLEGRVLWSGRSATLSYIGREQFRMIPCETAVWCPEGDQFARLRGVLALLFQREDAANGHDAQIYERLVSPRYEDRGLARDALLKRIAVDFEKLPKARLRVLGWQIRVERDSAEVGEDWELLVRGRAPERRRARYALAKEGELWSFVSGL